MSGIFIEILLTCVVYPAAGYWQQFEGKASARQSSLIASGASNNTNAGWANPAYPIMGQKSWVAVERRVKNMQCGELSHEI